MDNDNIQDIIKTRFRELPPEVQKAIAATDLTDKFDGISKKYSLRIDQSGILQTETLLVMLGLEKPADYLDNLVNNAELSREIAGQIVIDVNTQVLGTIRATLEKLTSEEDDGNTEVDNAALEKAANMDINNEKVSADVVSNGKENIQQMSPQMSKAITLDAIENPPPFMEKLLTGTVGSVTETVTRQAPAPAAAPAQKHKPHVDPYREPIE